MGVLICRAGIAGLALAQHRCARGWHVTLLEHPPGPREQGSVIDFFGSGYEAVDAMGILPRLKQLAYPVGEAAFIDDRGRRCARINYARFAGALNGAARTGEVSSIAGEWQAKRLVLMEFPSVDKARAWSASPEYQATLSIRHRSATTHLVSIIDGD